MNLPEEEHHNNFTDTSSGLSAQEKYPTTFSNNHFGESTSLDKVRSILFGNQIQEFEKRFTRIEDRLVKECGNLRDETKKRLDSLENYIKTEIEALAEQLTGEQVKRDEALNALSEEQKNLTASVDKKLAQFEEQTTTRARELRQQILNQSQTLHDDIRQKYEEILALLQREAQEIRAEKTDRSALAAMFTELAMRLNSKA
ncbi:hypothetical protein [Chlorogloeopsis sp. ULAP02]|uniref:hypothetical protein n=1 Tax=Chlorogloeopsis sp. ULAP02 TaxID=3107926 RepID=UPI0031360F5B